jgi:glycosyltransferase involved in cell wall biosynthesis
MRTVGSRLQPVIRTPLSEPLEPDATLVCFSHLRWNFVTQRPQHLLRRAARHYRVLFIEEPLFEAVDAPRITLSRDAAGVTVATPVLPWGTDEGSAEALQRELIDDLLAGEAPGEQLFWYYTPMAFGFSAHHRPALCVYDCMDDLSGFRFAPPQLVEREAALLRRADLVFTGGHSLYEAKRGRHASVHAFPSSIDAAHFGKARRSGGREPHDQAGLSRPRLGFFGVIDERMDLELVDRMAALRPAWQFVMIGPVAKVDADSLPRRDNIHWLGGRDYEQLPDYLGGWDVGLMPFALNEATRFISPTKTPEFLAAGVPVVSTPIVDVVRSYGRSGLVEIAADADHMVAKAEALLARPEAGWLERVDSHLAALSWDRTWADMHALMRRKVSPASEHRPAASSLEEAAHV